MRRPAYTVSALNLHLQHLSIAIPSVIRGALLIDEQQDDWPEGRFISHSSRCLCRQCLQPQYYHSREEPEQEGTKGYTMLRMEEGIV